MGIFDEQRVFVLDGAEYEHAALRPELVAGSVRRFVYGGEPEIIAQVPLKGGGKVEVHGFATHYNQEWVCVEWTDDVFSHCACWVPSVDVRRPATGEWHGRYVPFG